MRDRIGTRRPHCFSTTSRVASTAIQLRPKTRTEPTAVNVTPNRVSNGHVAADASAAFCIRTTQVHDSAGLCRPMNPSFVEGCVCQSITHNGLLTFEPLLMLR